MKTWIKQTIIPVSMIIILSSCFVLGWYLYRTVYLPLLTSTNPVFTANDYAVPKAKLDLTIKALDARAETTTDFSSVPNLFTHQ